MPKLQSQQGGQGRDTVLLTNPDRRLCVAPMMEWTDRHFRNLVRIIAPHALLYTEMVVDAAVVHGDAARLLGFCSAEHPVALQLGGSDPLRLAQAARIGADYGYDEINLNIGCPSGRVQQGRFGACLMAEPELVAQCVAAITAAVSVPVTVKTRIGIDQHDSYQFLHRFVDTVAGAGAAAVIVHARKAWLQGLSPKENRVIPPLDYQRVIRLAGDFPQLPIVINGGIDSPDQASCLLDSFAGVMIGRTAYQQPLMLGQFQQLLDPGFSPMGPIEVLQRYLPYIERELELGTPLHSITRHMMGLFQGKPGARHWRRQLSQVSNKPKWGRDFLHQVAAQAADAA